MGASHTWTIAIPTEHTVQVQHATHSGRVRILVDSQLVFEQSGPEALWDSGFDHQFTLDGLPCQIQIQFEFGTSQPRYVLLVKGSPV